MQTHYIFITGGVLSGLGKGITTASIGKLLQFRGFKVTVIKIDGYLNYDAGTLRPTEHGEVWVTEDGGEIDQDLGHYERFLDINVSKENNITSGQIFWSVIKKEREGKFLGKTVQMIPHVTDEIKTRIKEIAKKSGADFVLVEIGGTVGDYENQIFIEAARQMKMENEKCIYIHVSYIPVPKHLGEPKTKPTQHSVQKLRELGILPDFIICRSEFPVDDIRKEKIALFCNVKKEDVISDPDIENIYELPIVFEKQKLGKRILEKFGIQETSVNSKEWEDFLNKTKNVKKSVRIGIIGKYFDIGEFTLKDSYISVIEATKHAAWQNNVKAEILWIDSKSFEKDEKNIKILNSVDGVIIPGGFGSSGIEGKIAAIKYTRENKIPFLGLCLGLQLAVVEFARNVCGLKNANSTEFDPNTPYPVVDILPEQKKLIEESKYGATMRLGSYSAILKEGTIVWRLYNKQKEISERHRHRFEVNPEFHEILQKNGLVFSGMSPDGKLVEFIELEDHPYFVATQAHPEFKSRPLKPAPLFDGLIKACLSE
ncbi:MAG: CTP synthase [Candidatus Aenigmatarchaeota archaeon]